MSKDQLKNGLDLILLLDLTLATMDSYNFKGVVKNKANLFKRAIEKQVDKAIDSETQRDEEFVQNAITLKERMIKDIATMNEADQILLSEFVHKFKNNIEIARGKGVTFFNKII